MKKTILKITLCFSILLPITIQTDIAVNSDEVFIGPDLGSVVTQKEYSKALQSTNHVNQKKQITFDNGDLVIIPMCEFDITKKEEWESYVVGTITEKVHASEYKVQIDEEGTEVPRAVEKIAQYQE